MVGHDSKGFCERDGSKIKVHACVSRVKKVVNKDWQILT